MDYNKLDKVQLMFPNHKIHHTILLMSMVKIKYENRVEVDSCPKPRHGDKRECADKLHTSLSSAIECQWLVSRFWRLISFGSRWWGEYVHPTVGLDPVAKKGVFLPRFWPSLCFLSSKTVTTPSSSHKINIKHTNNFISYFV
jgi:hypothetical protein